MMALFNLKESPILNWFNEVKRGGKRYALIVRVFFVFFFVYASGLFFWKDNVYGLLDAKFGAGFGLSLFASFLEDFMFFGVIGALTIHVTTRKPEDEEISARIRSVTNGRFISESAKDYFEEKTKEVLAYNSDLHVVVKIKEYLQQQGVIRLYVEFNNSIRNMCKDVPFTEVNTVAVVKPASEVDGKWGSISHLTITDRNNYFEKEAVVEGDVIELGSEGFKRYIPYKISEDSEADYKLCYSIWSELTNDYDIDDNWFFTVVSRYTDSFSLSIINELKDIDMPILIKYPNRNTYTVAAKEVSRDDIIRNKENKTVVSSIRLYPEDKFNIFFNLLPNTTRAEERDDEVDNNICKA